MKVQAEVSVYPLRTRELSEPVNLFCQVLRSRGLHVQTRSMSMLVAGESQTVFDALREGFEVLAEQNDVAMNLTISNTCPDSMEQECAGTERVG